MSDNSTSNIVLEKEFMRFILTTNAKQCKYLLRNLTEAQTKALCEVAFNLLNLELSDHSRKTVNKYSTLLKKISKPKKSLKEKTKLLKQNSTKFHSCLTKVRNIILDAINQAVK